MATADLKDVVGVRLLNERRISTAEMDQHLREFLRRRHVKSGLSSEDYISLQALQKALKLEIQQLEEGNQKCNI